MNKKVKIIVFLMIVSLVLMAYLLLTSKEIKIKSEQKKLDNQQVQENLRRMEEEYKSDLKPILADFKVLMSTNSEEMTEVDQRTIGLRNRLMALTVPVQYRDLHLKLFLAFNKMDGATGERVNEVAQEISNTISEAETSYSWLR